MHQSPPFDDKSPHYIRLLCARVFGSAVGEQDRNRYEKILETALGDKNNEAAKVDITQALKMLKRVTL